MSTAAKRGILSVDRYIGVLISHKDSSRTELLNEAHHESADVKIASDSQTLLKIDLADRDRQLPRTVAVRRHSDVTVTSLGATE